MFTFLKNLFANHSTSSNFDNTDSLSTPGPTVINPATGQIMIGGVGGVDTSGNPFGVDSSSIHTSSISDTWSSDNHVSDSWSSTSGTDWSSSGSSFGSDF